MSEPAAAAPETAPESTSESTPESTPESNPATEAPATAVEVDVERLFRREVLVSEADLRIDAAARMDRGVAGDDDTRLREERIHVRGDATEHYGELDRHVAGKYERSVGGTDLFLVGERYEERYEGGVDYHASLESQAIVGGGYAGVVAGPCLRLSGWVDYLGWGGWAESDAARVEIAGLMIRSHLAYCHLSGARVVRASTLVDDFATRIETFGTGAETYGTVIHAGAPGSGVTLET